MIASTTLRVCLLGLVLTNLVYVHLTNAVDTLWMLPLYGLTAASPWLVRFAGSFVYRMVWNAGVLSIFGLLLHHASRGGVHSLLEDGLILAGFSQVHLLNNLTARQKPDLLFFNSFLITLVTSFFCQDLVYSLVFIVYATLLIVGMQLVVLGPTAEAGAVRALVVDGCRRAVVILALTAATFLTLPRDFNREGMITEELAQAGLLEVGFNERVELGRSGRTAISNRVVLRVRLREGQRQDVPWYWRGATCTLYDGRGWRTQQERQDRTSLDPVWGGDAVRGWVRPGSPVLASVEVEMVGVDNRLFAPLHATLLRATMPPIAYAVADGTFQFYSPFGTQGEGESLRYRVDLVDGATLAGIALRPNDTRLSPYLRILPRSLPDVGVELAKQLIRDLPQGATRREVVETFRHYLATHFDYLLPGAQGAADSLPAFLNGDGGGHCEYFATALALMLRTHNVPCRVVTGYCSNEWDEAGRVLTIRSRNAHAWVEVLDHDGRWYTVDATPPTSPADLDAALPWWERLQNAARRLWAKVTGFDSEARAAAIAWALGVPGRLAAWSQKNPWSTGTMLAALASVWIGVRRRRRARWPHAVHSYLQALRRAGVVPRDGETPRETLARATAAGLREATLRELASATDEHEERRFAGG